jgi:hypothetical protein
MKVDDMLTTWEMSAEMDPRLSYAQRAACDQHRVSRRPEALEEARPVHFIKEYQKGYE